MDAYAAWAPAYPPRPHNRLMEVEQEAVLGLLPPVAGRRVLDAGCGTGRYVQRLRALGATRVIGCDRSAGMLSHADGRDLVRADIRALPLASGSFDLVVCGLALNDIDDVAAPIVEMARVLAPGGSVVASLLHPRGAAEGWRRTFDTREGTREVPAFWHTLDDVRAACARAGLTMGATREPGLESRQPLALVFRAGR